MADYQQLQHKEALRYCLGILDNARTWHVAVRQFAVAIVLKIAYGLDVEGPESRWIKLAETVSQAISKSGAPASSLMDRIPASKDTYLQRCVIDLSSRG